MNIPIVNDSFHKCQFGTINIRSGKEKSEGAKMYSITKEISRVNLTFCALQEVRYRNTGKKLIETDSGQKYQFMWCGQKKRRDAGVGLLIKIDHQIIIEEPDFNTPRVMAVNLTIFGYKIRLVIGYSPTNVDGSDLLKAEFYRNLRKAIANPDNNRKLIVLGDFNAQTEIVHRKTEFDGTNILEDNICNDNRQRLKSFCRSNRLCIPQTFFDHPLEERYTWFSCDKKTKKVIDYVLLQRCIQQYVTECEVKKDVDFDSDHRLLVTSINTPKSKAARWKPNLAKPKKLNIESLRDDKTRAKFIGKTVELMDWRESVSTASEISENLINTLSKAAQCSLPTKDRKSVNQFWKNDEQLNSLLNQRSNFQTTSDEYKKLRKSIKRRVRFLRNKKISDEAGEINSFATKRQIEELYRSFKEDNIGSKNVSSVSKCDP